MTLPIHWVERIFNKLSVHYGREFIGRWQGIPLEDVKQDWAEVLGGFKDQPEALAYALANLPDAKAPTAQEFRAICRLYREPSKPALTHKLTPEEQAKASQVVSEAAKTINAAKRDTHDWAKRPKSAIAFNAVLDLANRGDSVFAKYVEDLREAGHVVGNKLVRGWNGSQWVRV